MLVFLLFLMPITFGFSPVREVATCTCPTVSNAHKTGQGSGSITFAWNDSEATQYKLWYFREGNDNPSSPVYTTGTSYSYSNLAAGNYTFYFVTVCGGEESGWIGVEDIVFT